MALCDRIYSKRAANQVSIQKRDKAVKKSLTLLESSQLELM